MAVHHFSYNHERPLLTASPSTIEMNIGILAGCLPVLSPLIHRIASYDGLASGLSSLNNHSRRLRKILSPTWRSSGGHGERDSESLKDLKFNGEGKGHIERPSVGDVDSAAVGGERRMHMERPSMGDVELGMSTGGAQGEEPLFVMRQGKASTERGRREGY